MGMLPPDRPLLYGTLNTIWVFFSTSVFLSGRDSGLVSLRRVRNWLVWPFSISVDFARD